MKIQESGDILTNSGFKEDWIKIGKSYRPVNCMTASRQKHELSVGLYMDSDKSIYYRYQSMSQQIEEELGMKVQWREANKASWVLIARTLTALANIVDTPQMKASALLHGIDRCRRIRLKRTDGVYAVPVGCLKN